MTFLLFFIIDVTMKRNDICNGCFVQGVAKYFPLVLTVFQNQPYPVSQIAYRHVIRLSDRFLSV